MWSIYGPAIQILWTIWNTADPITTKMNNAISSGDTGYCSSFLDVLLTLPRLVMFFWFFSLAFFIRGVVGILILFIGVYGRCMSNRSDSGRNGYISDLKHVVWRSVVEFRICYAKLLKLNQYSLRSQTVMYDTLVDDVGFVVMHRKKVRSIYCLAVLMHSWYTTIAFLGSSMLLSAPFINS